MVEKTPVKYNPVTHKHEPYEPGETIPASMAPVRVGQTDYYPESHIAPPLLPGKHVWLNDPQPFLYDEKTGNYVLWYLYNEDDDTENGTAWREVLTKDFVTFTDNGVRIPKYTTPYGDIWSGSPYLDSNNLFGFGAGAVLYYVTMPCDKAGPGKQSVALWVAAQGLGHDPKFVDIVIPNAEDAAFRDPKVFLGEDQRTLFMLIAVDSGIATFSSLDGKNWKRVSTLPLDGLGTIECPDLVTIDGQQVLIFSANGYEQAPTTTQTMFLLVKVSYGVITITQARPSVIKRMCIDTGPDFYAGRCGQTTTGTNIMLAWANNWNYAQNLPLPDYNGTLALPRVLDLHTFSDGYVGVVCAPVSGRSQAYAKVVTQTGVALSGDYSPIPYLDVPESSRIEFTIRKDPSNGWPKTFGVFIGSGDVKSFSTVISMNGDGTGTGQPYVENTRNDYGGRPYNSIKEWNEYYRAYLYDVLEEINLTIIVDRGTAEVFINGLYSQTFQVLWPIGAQFLRLSIPEGYTLSGDSTLRYNRRAGRVNGAFTRAHADSIYMFNTEPVITSYDGDKDNPHTHKVLQIAYDDRGGPFLQTTYGGPYINFWQISPKFLDLIVYSIQNEYVETVKQIFVDKDPTKGVGVKTSYGADTIYLATRSSVEDVQKALDSTKTNTEAVSKNVTDLGGSLTVVDQKVSNNSNSIINVQQQVSAYKSAVDAELESINSKTSDNTSRIFRLQSQISAGPQSGSPNTAANPALLDRYPIQQADVAKFLVQSAEQKAQGQSYAGKYALTPQIFQINSDGILKITPYGLPPTDGVTTTALESVSVPIITDACSQYYDEATGIHYRWDQFQADSKKFRGQHWDLDGPVVSVSLDGLKWVPIRTIAYTDSGGPPRTAFWIDRDNRLGHGPGTLLVGGMEAMFCLPNLTAAAGVTISSGGSTEGDYRVYYDPDVFKTFCVLGVNSSNTHLIVRSGTPGNFNTSFEIDHALFAGTRVECPSWVPMFDTANQTKRMVISIALQPASGPVPTHYESMVLGALTYTTSGVAFTEDLRYVEYGADAYAQIVVDPLQQDGTGGKRNGCDKAVCNVGSYAWSYLNGNKAVPSFGFGAGAHIPADVVLTNGVPYLLPNAKFNSACSGAAFTGSAFGQGTNATNPGWTLGITKRSDVWRAQMDVDSFTFSGTSTIRFHFGNRYADYIFGKGLIDFNPNESGTTVLFPNTGGTTSRVMPLTRNFVSGTANTLVWEYDNGRIRLYNTATGEVMSEKIFPDGNQLSTVEILGNDFFVSGFTFTVRLDSGTNY